MEYQRATLGSDPFALRRSGDYLLFNARGRTKYAAWNPGLPYVLPSPLGEPSPLPPNFQYWLTYPLAESGGIDGILQWAKAPGESYNLWLFPSSQEEGSPRRMTDFSGNHAPYEFLEAIPEDSGGGVLFAHGTKFHPTESYLEIWHTDGTESGAAMVVRHDLAQEIVQRTWWNGELHYLIMVNNYMEWWKTDGTPAGTSKVPLTPEAGFGSTPEGIVFTSIHPVSGSGTTRELFLTDGTTGGSVLLGDLRPGAAGSFPRDFVSARDKVFFTATANGTTRSLWVTDGSASGTHNLAAEAAARSVITTPEGDAFFRAPVPGITALALWETDGTIAGTQAIRDNEARIVIPSPKHAIVILGEDAVFVRDSGELELWITDGSREGTRQIHPTQRFSDFGEIVSVGNLVYFVAEEGLYGRELWSTDGSDESTRLVSDLSNENGHLNWSLELTGTSGEVYFAASDTHGGTEPWRFGLVEGSPQPLADLVPGGASSAPTSFTKAGDTVIFVAKDAAGNKQLWSVDDPTAPLTDWDDGTGIQFSLFFPDTEGCWFFTRSDKGPGAILWFTDGTISGTRAVERYLDGPGKHFPRILGIVGERIYFTRETIVNGRELWSTRLDTLTTGGKPWTDDALPSGATLARDISPGAQNSDIRLGSPVNGALVFTMANADGTHTLWRSDGTPEGTLPILSPDSPGSFSSTKRLNDGRLVVFFLTSSGTLNYYLTDGTFAGTVVNDGNIPDGLPYSPEGFTNRRIEYTGSTKLHFSDGTEAGRYEWIDEWNTGLKTQGAIFHSTRNGIWIQEIERQIGTSLSSPGRLWKMQHGGGIAQIVMDFPTPREPQSSISFYESGSNFYRHDSRRREIVGFPDLPPVILTEVQPANENSETDFLELYDGGVGRTLLTGYSLAIYAGDPAVCRRTISLEGLSTDENGFLVIASSNEPWVDFVVDIPEISEDKGAVSLFIGPEPPVGEPPAEDLFGVADAFVFGDPEESESDYDRLRQRSASGANASASRQRNMRRGTDLPTDGSPDLPPTPGAVPLETQTSGDEILLTGGHRRVVIPISISEAGRYVIFSTGTADTIGRLTGPDGEVASDGNSGIESNFLIAKTLPPGNYALRVETRNSPQDSSVHVKRSDDLDIRSQMYFSDNGDPDPLSSNRLNITIGRRPAVFSWHAVNHGELPDRYTFTAAGGGRDWRVSHYLASGENISSTLMTGRFTSPKLKERVGAIGISTRVIPPRAAKSNGSKSGRLTGRGGISSRVARISAVSRSKIDPANSCNLMMKVYKKN